MTEPRIETERLILRRWFDIDLAPFAEICSDRDVMKFIATGRVLTEAETRDAIRNMEETWRTRKYGTFAVENRTSGAFLGAVGFSPHSFFPSVSPCIEIGWRLARASWSKGYATEAAHAALAFGTEKLGLSDIHCFCQSENHASQRIATKIGMTELDRVTSPTYQREVIIYRTPQEEFRP